MCIVGLRDQHRGENLLSQDGEAVPSAVGGWLWSGAPTSLEPQRIEVPAALAAFSQVQRMQDRLPPDLPGRGQEGLPPLCPPTQIPGAEQSHLIPPLVPTRDPGLSHPSRVGHQPGHTLKVSQSQENSRMRPEHWPTRGSPGSP